MVCTHAPIILLAAVALGCSERGVGPITTPRLVGYTDGATGGNPHFFFLPPLVPAPTPTGTFDPSLAPVVEICELAATTCIFPLVAEFTTDDSRSERVRVVLEDEHYIVNWHTARFGLDPTRTYRITVGTTLPSSGLLELGYADVTGVGRRTLPLKFRIEEGATQLALGTVVGNSTVVIPRADACGRADGRLCESKIGNVVADAMRTTYGVDFAITNSGGLRADLTCPVSDTPGDFCPAYTPPPYPITRGQALAVLPFGNVVVTLSVDGAELRGMLENGVSQMPGAAGRFPQVSGLCFTYVINAPVGSRVTDAVRQAADGTCSGAPVDLTAGSTFTIAENDFMVGGGDGYQNFSARAAHGHLQDRVVADYIAGQGVISPAIQGRIVCTTTGTPCPVVIP